MKVKKDLLHDFESKLKMQKEPKLWPWNMESWDTFHDFMFLYAHIRDNRFENNAKFVKTSKL